MSKKLVFDLRDKSPLEIRHLFVMLKKVRKQLAGQGQKTSVRLKSTK
jgi:hypothetical protein